MFNECSNDVFDLYSEQNRASVVDLHARSYRRLRSLFPHVPSQIAIRAQHDCRAAYQAARTKGRNLTKHIKTNLSIRLDYHLYSWKGKDIQITAIGGKRIQCGLTLYPKMMEMFATAKVGDPLIYVRENEIWLAIPFSIPELIHIKNHCVGIDLGCRMLVVTSDGKAISGKEISKHKRRIRYLKRELKRKATSGSRSAKRHLKRIRRKEARFTLNYTHHIANELLKTDANTLVLENLSGIKRRKGKPRGSLSRIHQIPFGLLKTILTYKAQARGKRVVTVPARNTSRLDSRGLDPGERRGRRYYAVDGHILDAELNAAINIAARYARKHPDSQHPVSLVFPFDGSLKPHGQGLVNGPIVEGMILMSDHRNGVALQAFTSG